MLEKIRWTTFTLKIFSVQKYLVIKKALQRKILSNIYRGKLTEINLFLTEQTPKINRLTDRSNFSRSRIPNRSIYSVWLRFFVAKFFSFSSSWWTVL